MDKLWIAISVGIPFMIIGTVCVLYAHRFGRWWIGLNVHLNKISPLFGYSEQNREEIEHNFYDKWPRRGFWLFWLWGMRIMGAGLAIAGALTLLVILLNL